VQNRNAPIAIVAIVGDPVKDHCSVCGRHAKRGWFRVSQESALTMTWEEMSRTFQRAASRGRNVQITTATTTQKSTRSTTATTMSASVIVNPYSRKKQQPIDVDAIEVVDTDDDAIEIVDTDDEDEVELVQVRQVTPTLSSRMEDDDDDEGDDDDDDEVVVVDVRPTTSPNRRVATKPTTSSPLPPQEALSKPKNASISRPKETMRKYQSVLPTLDKTRAKPASAVHTLKAAISKPKSALVAPKKILVPPKPRTALVASKVAKYQPLLATLPDARSKLQNLLDARNEASAKQKSALLALKENMSKYKNGLIARSVEQPKQKSSLTVLKEAQLKQKSALVARKATLLNPKRPLHALTKALPKRINALDALKEARSKRTSAGIAVEEALPKRKIVLIATDDARPTSKRVVVPSSATMSKQASSAVAPKQKACSERLPSSHVDQLERFFFALLQFGRYEADWAELCRRANVPMPSLWSWGTTEPTTEPEHFGAQAALMLEEARHNLAQALPSPSSSTANRGPMNHKLSVRVLHVATVVRPTQRSVDANGNQENTPPTHNVKIQCHHSGGGIRFSRGGGLQSQSSCQGQCNGAGSIVARCHCDGAGKPTRPNLRSSLFLPILWPGQGQSHFVPTGRHAAADDSCGFDDRAAML
jgi:hypothetical protein